jgi:hypothetical protein
MISDVDSSRNQLCTLGCFPFWNRRDGCDGEGIPNFGIRDLCLFERASNAGGEGESFRNVGIERFSEGC